MIYLEESPSKILTFVLQHLLSPSLVYVDSLVDNVKTRKKCVFSYLMKSFMYRQGKVKQIVGSTLSDMKGSDSTLVTNFESDKSAAEYAALYKEDGLVGGHVIMLGADPLSNESAIGALHAYPGRMVVVNFTKKKKSFFIL